ncbi:MAG: LysM peptidoglycan-binding domain-containing protein [Planctomycetaceae bacterium]|nr:LysM peptidoglycan-binding domain-containing protein [Planctomycetaceae bacterium]
MSNKKNTSVGQESEDKQPEEESSGFFSLEAKAGLSLICILICGFSFMVWQQWKHQQPKIVAEHDDSESQKDVGIVLQPNLPDGTQKTIVENKDVPETVFDPFGNQSEPTVTTEDAKNNDIVELKTAAVLDDDPFGEVASDVQPTKANIPTLEVPVELAEELADATQPKTTSGDNSQPDLFDPFGGDAVVKNDNNDTPPKLETNKSLPQADPFDPFGAEMELAGKKPIIPDGQTPAKLPEIEATPKVAQTEEAKSLESDPFATIDDPFGTIPAKETKETPVPAFTENKPASQSENDPFAEPSENTPAIIPKGNNSSAVATINTFQDPLPILEPVPNAKKSPAEPNPFGQFESIPAGSAQASSVTDVAPEFPDLKQKGTLADLHSKSSSGSGPQKYSSALIDDPFSEPKVTQKPEPFHLQQDGTYKVQSGDSYWSISRQAYGSPLYYRALAEFNEKAIPNPENMTAGTAIQIPSSNDLERRYPHLVSTKRSINPATIVKTSAEQNQNFFNDEAGTPVYRVQKNDTLTGIAQKYLGRASRWIQIYELNRNNLANPNNLKIDTLLKLPHDASRVKFVRE